MNRRSLLKQTAALGSTIPLWMPRVAFAAPPRQPSGDVLVCIFLRGGVDGLNTVIPYAEDAYYQARPSLAIPVPGKKEGAAIDLDGFFGLHPALAPLKDIYAETNLAVVHAVGSPHETRSHFDAMDYMERGTPGQKRVGSGWIGRHLAAVNVSHNGNPFRAVGFGRMLQTSLRGPVPALALKSIADFHLAGRGEAVKLFQTALAGLYAPGESWLQAQGAQVFNAFSLLEKANPLQYKPAAGITYPDSEFGLAIKQVAQLIKSDMGLEAACVDAGGWDTHINQGGADGQMAALLGDFAAGLAAFHADIHSHIHKVTVVTMSEFGRRVAENGGGGTDHGHGNCMFLMGGGLKGGQVYARWPTLHPDALDGPGDLAITTDFRDVLGEVLRNRLGNINLTEVFPGYDNFQFVGVTYTI